MCSLLMRTTSLGCVGKDHQKKNHVHVDQCCSCSSQIDADAARRVCALESSSLLSVYYMYLSTYCCKRMRLLTQLYMFRG